MSADDYRTSMKMEWDSFWHDCRLQDPNAQIFPNQEETAFKIVETFKSGIPMVMLIAGMQAGKTGTVLSAAYNTCIHMDDHNLIKKNNVYFISGMSDIDWVNQMKDSLPPTFAKNVYHRPQINVNMFKDSRDMLIILDESHIAANETQTIGAVFSELGFADPKLLIERNIYILMVSATPNHTGHYMLTYGDYSKVVKMIHPHNYCGLQDLLKQGRLKEATPLNVKENAKEFFDNALQLYTIPKYHIIRCIGKVATEIRDTVQTLCAEYDWNFRMHNSITYINDVDTLLDTPPKRHTVILIKGFWRASKRFSAKNIGQLHDFSADDSVTAQGLGGRMCGYNKNSDEPPIVYLNMTGVERYIKWIENDSDYRNIDYYCNTVKANKKRGVKSKKPWNNGGSALPDNTNDDNYVSLRFKIPERIDEHFLTSVDTEVKKFIGNYEIRKRKAFDPSRMDELGFYKTALRGGKPHVWTMEEVDKQRKSCLNEKTNVRQFIGYENLSDKTSGTLVVNIYVPNKTVLHDHLCSNIKEP